MTEQLALRTAGFCAAELSMDDIVAFRRDCESEFALTYADLDKTIQRRKKLTMPEVAKSVERDICIEVRSLFVAFRTLSLLDRFDETLAVRVQAKLQEALGVVTVEQNCIFSIRNRLQNEFDPFIKWMRTDTPPHATEEIKRTFLPIRKNKVGMDF